MYIYTYMQIYFHAAVEFQPVYVYSFPPISKRQMHIYFHAADRRRREGDGL
jgi:hypothetical protein